MKQVNKIQSMTALKQSKPSSLESEEGLDQSYLNKPRSLEDILREPNLFKYYANSKSKNPLIEKLVAELSDSETISLLNTLKPIAKTICKNKYGNYIVQVMAKSLSPHHHERLLDVLQDDLIEIICHPKGTFAIQGVIAALKMQSLQLKFFRSIKPHINQLSKNKEGSYIIKEIYRHFDKSVLNEVSRVFFDDIAANVSDKFAICIFKEIVRVELHDPVRFKSLLSDFLLQQNELRFNTFYHFGVQCLLESIYELNYQSKELAQFIIDFSKHPKNMFRSRATSDTVLKSLDMPPISNFRQAILGIILSPQYLNTLSGLKIGPEFIYQLQQHTTPEEWQSASMENHEYQGMQNYRQT